MQVTRTARLNSIRRRLITALACAAAVGAAIVYATVPDQNKVYAACMLRSLGTIRLIDKSLPASNLMSHCTDKELEVFWNQAGQPGLAGIQGEKGDPGSPGQDGANGTNGAAGTDGVSVATESEPEGTNCANGGAKFTAANGVTYACNGAPGGQPFVISTDVPLQPPDQIPVFTDIFPWPALYHGTLRVRCQQAGLGSEETDVDLRIRSDAAPAGGSHISLSAFLPPDGTSPSNFRAYTFPIGTNPAGGGVLLLQNIGLLGSERWSYDYRVRRLDTRPDGSLVLSSVQVLVGLQRLADGSCRVATRTVVDS